METCIFRHRGSSIYLTDICCVINCLILMNNNNQVIGCGLCSDVTTAHARCARTQRWPALRVAYVFDGRLMQRLNWCSVWIQIIRRLATHVTLNEVAILFRFTGTVPFCYNQPSVPGVIAMSLGDTHSYFSRSFVHVWSTWSYVNRYIRNMS